MILRALKLAWNKWKRIAHTIGNFQARFLLSIFYVVVVGPFALGLKLFSDPLRLRPGTPGGWLPRPSPDPDPTVRARRQF